MIHRQAFPAGARQCSSPAVLALLETGANIAETSDCTKLGRSFAIPIGCQ